MFSAYFVDKRLHYLSQEIRSSMWSADTALDFRCHGPVGYLVAIRAEHFLYIEESDCIYDGVICASVWLDDDDDVLAS